MCKRIIDDVFRTDIHKDIDDAVDKILELDAFI
jgi:hypothetical protein